MNEDFYINLIYKKLSGELNASDKEKLDVWLAASKDNRLTATSVETVWKSSDALQVNEEVDLDKEFAVLESKMEEDKPLTSSKKAVVKELNPNSKPRRNWLAMAAGLFILLAAGFLLWNNFSGGDTNQAIASNEWQSVFAGAYPQTANLSDGSKVYLNRQTKVEYQNTFDGGERLVKLKRGEAFFEVAHDASKPFIVQTDYERITVLGTSFNVNTKPQSLTYVYVAEGKVELFQRHTKKKVILNKGERGESSTNVGEVKNQGQQTPNDLAWRTKRLEFIDTPLAQVLAKLTEVYGAKFGMNNALLRECPFTGIFENQEIDQVLETLSTVFDMKVEKKTAKNYVIEGGSCE